MSSHPASTLVIADHGAPRSALPIAPGSLVEGAASHPGQGDEGLNKLSKRLWTMEIHRRLELQTRRAL